MNNQQKGSIHVMNRRSIILHILQVYVRLNIHVRMLAHPAAVTSYEGSFAKVGDLHYVPCYWVRIIPILSKYAIHKEHLKPWYNRLVLRVISNDSCALKIGRLKRGPSEQEYI